MATISAGSSPLITIARGNALILTGNGLATMSGGPRANQTLSIVGSATIGPFDSDQNVLVYAISSIVYLFDNNLGDYNYAKVVYDATGNVSGISGPDGAKVSLGAGNATITGNYAVGQVLTATYPVGTIGTIQFTRTLAVAPFTKTAISGAVANAVNSLTYTVQSADAGYNIGVDCSNQVSSAAGGVVAAAAVLAQLVVFAGQSQTNSNGNTNAQTVPAAIAGPMSNVFIWDPFGKAWLTYQAQVTSAAHLKGGLYPDTSNNYFGAEAEYARRWVVDNPGVPLYMLKKGHSTTSLSQAARTTNRGCWDPALRGDLYDEFLSWMADAKSNLVAAGKTVNIRGMNWVQGENDANLDAATATAYASNLSNFIDSLRSAGAITNTTPFIISRIQTGTWAFPAQLRTSQQTVGDSKANCRWFSADACTIDGADTVHYGPNGVVIHGDAMYEEGLSGAETVRSYVAKTTVAPSASQQTQMAAFIDNLIANNVWSGIAVMQLYSASTEQAALLNVRSGAVTAVNSGMTFTPGIGYTGTSTSSFINTNVNPVTGDSKLDRGNVSYAFYVRGNISTTGVDVGFIPTTSGNGIVLAAPQSTSSAGAFRINNSNSSAENTLTGPADVSGLWSGSRKALNSATYFFRGAQIGTTDTVNTDVGESSNVIFLGNRNSGNNTSGTNGTLRQYGMFIAGSGRTPAQEMALNTAVSAYLSSIGAN